MSCIEKQNAFEQALTQGARELEAGLGALMGDVEKRAKKLSDEYEAGNDLAEGVGAATGTVVGGFFGGPLGAGVGGEVGRAIGSLFVMKIAMRRTEFKMDVPETRMKDKEMSFDSPVITMNDKKISFDTPVVVMKRTRGPDQPVPVCRMRMRRIGPVKTKVPECKIEMRATYLDRPEVEMRRQEFILGLPEMKMVRQRFVVGIPEFTMKTQTFSFDTPHVYLTFVQDAGKRLAAKTSELVLSAEAEARNAEASLKEQLKLKVAPPAIEMFECFQGELQASRAQVTGMFDPQLALLGTSLSSLLGQGVPEGDAKVVEVRQQMANVAKSRAEALTSIDEAIAELEKSMKETLENLFNDDTNVDEEEDEVEAAPA